MGDLCSNVPYAIPKLIGRATVVEGLQISSRTIWVDDKLKAISFIQIGIKNYDEVVLQIETKISPHFFGNNFFGFSIVTPNTDIHVLVIY